MAGKHNTQREQKKAMIRSNMLEGKRKRFSFRIPDAVWEYKNYIALAVLVVAAAAAAMVIVVKTYGYFRTYSTYEVNWSVEISNASSAECINFMDGLLMVGKDGVKYYDQKGTEKWAVPYEMKSPTAVTEGNYVLIYDWKGQSMTVCSKNGKMGSMTTSYPISRADVSAGGVTAAVLEDTKSSYISYYRSSGEALEVNIQSPFATSGYPLDISISPNGQQLAVSYYYVGGGNGMCRVDFYDFEKGKEIPDRIVGTFSYKETDTYIPLVSYSSNSSAFAVGDNRICFYSAADRTQIEQKSIEVYGEIRKVFYNETYLGVLIEENDELEIRIYDMDGKEKAAVGQDSIYDKYAFEGKQIVMYNENHCKVIAFSGRERFDLHFINGIESMAPAGKERCLYLTTLNLLQKITLK